MKPYVAPPVLARRYREARFVVLPLHDTSQFSAGCTTALEAHAAGKAIVATRTRGMADFVVDGVTGLLVPPGDAQALAQAIGELWSQPERAHQMGIAGRRHVEANFDPGVTRERLRAALRQTQSPAGLQPAIGEVP